MQRPTNTLGSMVSTPHVFVGRQSGHSVDHDRSKGPAPRSSDTGVQGILQAPSVQQIALSAVEYVGAQAVICVNVQHGAGELPGQVEGQGGLAAALWAVYLHDPPTGYSPAYGGVQRGRPVGMTSCSGRPYRRTPL